MRFKFLFFIFLFCPSITWAAVGCDLNNPDRDVKRLFPGSTGYKTRYFSMAEKAGDGLLEKIQERLGDKFHGLYETVDVPYTLYEIFKGSEKIGYIHGVNQKGKYGGIQVFLALDLEGNIKASYFQKLTSRSAKLLRDSQFTDQFKGLNLKDFYGYDVSTGKSDEGSRVKRIVNPSPEAEEDFRATLRCDEEKSPSDG